MSVDRTSLQTAFAKAHRAACDESLDPSARKRFKEIAAEIWRACGEQQTMPATLPSELQALAPDPQAARKHELANLQTRMEALTPGCQWESGLRIDAATQKARDRYQELKRAAGKIEAELGY